MNRSLFYATGQTKTDETRRDVGS